MNGKVYLVGAGPGDPGLITVRGKELLQCAEVIVYDHLVNPEILDWTPVQAERIYAGKVKGKHVMTQEEIHAILVEKARQFSCVVRLKGGDPFVFGRGAEECLHLREHQIEFEVVPGVSALTAVPAYAGIPITSRDFSSQFVAVTGHEHACKDSPDVDWSSLAQVNGTLVIFMGVLNIHQITTALLHHGKSPETPTAVIQWGTYAHQKTITGTLETIASQVEKSNLRPPGLIVIGEAVRFHEQISWFKVEKNSSFF